MDAVRVGFDTGPLHGQRTGIGLAVEALHDSLSHRDDVQIRDYLLSFRARPGHDVRRLPLPAALAHRCWARSDRPSIDRWLRDVDVVHGTNYVVPPRARAPRVVSVYDCWFLRHEHRASAAVVRAGRVLRRSIDGGAVVHASSQATASAVAELFPGVDVRTVHLGALPVAPPPLRCPVPELDGRPFVVAIGTIERRKNLPRLVRAFGSIAGEHPDLQLVIAGADGDDRPSVDAAVDALGPRSAPRVAFTGRIDDATRSWLLHHARVLAYPSLDEGFGFPLLDAMQVALPVVAACAGSIPEVAGDAALLHDPTDVDGLAAALHRALTDEQERQRLVTAGARWQQFDWAACAAGLVAIYCELAGSPRR